MSLLYENIKSDRNKARKLGFRDDLATVNMVIDRIQKKEKEIGRELEDKDIVSLVQTFDKQLNEEKQGYLDRGNNERVKYIEDSQDMIALYIPKQLEESEIRDVVEDAIHKLASDGLQIGLVMKEVMKRVDGIADKKLTSQIVKEEVNKYA